MAKRVFTVFVTFVLLTIVFALFVYGRKGSVDLLSSPNLVDPEITPGQDSSLHLARISYCIELMIVI